MDSRTTRKWTSAWWTAERTEEAQRLWRANVSASVIAQRLGNVTRNGVIGKMHRTLGKKDPASARMAMSLSGKMKAARKKRAVKTAKTAKPPKVSRRPPAHFSFRRPTEDELAVSAAEWRALMAEMERQDAARTDLIALVDLEPHHCRWPIGEPTRGFCGDQKIPGASYCECHLARSRDGKLDVRFRWAEKRIGNPSNPEQNIAELHETVAA